MEKYVDLGKASAKTIGMWNGKFTDVDPLQSQGPYRQHT